MGDLVQFPVRRVELPSIVTSDVHEGRLVKTLFMMGYNRSQIACRLMEFRRNFRELSRIAEQEDLE